jgi:hypothetical protein
MQIHHATDKQVQHKKQIQRIYWPIVLRDQNVRLVTDCTRGSKSHCSLEAVCSQFYDAPDRSYTSANDNVLTDSEVAMYPAGQTG